MIASKRYGSKVQLNYLQNGDISYFITYKTNKKTVFKKVGKKSEGINEAKAIELRNQILSEIRHGIDLSQKSIKTLSFQKLADIYFSSNDGHNKSNKKYKQQYELHIKASFGDLPIIKLEDSLIYEFQSLKIAEGLSESTINILVKLIKRIIGFGIKRGVLTYSPFKNIKLFKVDNSRIRYLNNNEIKMLNDLIKDDLVLKLFIKIALTTGARAVSVLSLQKKHFSLENRNLLITDFKRNNTYLGYLDNETFELIKNHTNKFMANHFIVSSDGKSYKYQTIYKKLTKILKIFNEQLSKNDRANRVVIHTLRHTFASHLAKSGVSIQKIQKLMNHKDIKQTLKYAKLNPDSGQIEVEDLYKEI